MTPQEFCYWLQGFFELSGPEKVEITARQAEIIERHLKLVFHHSIDPSYEGDQALMQAIHDEPLVHLSSPDIRIRC